MNKNGHDDHDTFFERYSEDEVRRAFDLVADQQGKLPDELASFQESYDQPSPQQQEIKQTHLILGLRQALFKATPRIIVTPLLVAANVIVYLAMYVTADLVALGANDGPKTLAGEEWRLFTSTFLHGGAFHILLNMYVLWQIGKLLERLTGNAGFLVLYVGSGLIGSLASIYWNPGVSSIGASGAVFGSFGALLGFLWWSPRSTLALFKPLLKNIFWLILVNLGIGLAINWVSNVPRIDMAAHVGGLVAGLVFGTILSRSIITSTARDVWIRNGLAVGFSVLVIAAGLYWAPREIAAELHRLDTAYDQERQETNRLVKAISGKTDEEGIFSRTFLDIRLLSCQRILERAQRLRLKWPIYSKIIDERIKKIEELQRKLYILEKLFAPKVEGPEKTTGQPLPPNRISVPALRYRQSLVSKNGSLRMKAANTVHQGRKLLPQQTPFVRSECHGSG